MKDDLQHSYSSVPTDEKAAEANDNAVSEQVVAINVEAQRGNTGETPEEKEHRIEAMFALTNEISRLQDLSDQASKTLSNLRGFWGGKENDLNHTLEDLGRKQSLAKEEYESLSRVGTDEGDSLPPGPKSLYWVRGGKFTAVCSLVVIINLVTMFMEMMHDHYKKQFFVLDQVVLVFYITEIVLKALLFRNELLCGPCSFSWWNWLDLCIVIAGILDQWVKPLIPTSGGDDQGGSVVQVVKMLRIARLARILKTVRAFLQSDLSWAEGKHFQLFIMGTIAFNSLVMSFESDIPDFWGWFYVEQILLMIFSFELTVRLRRWHCRFFYHETDFGWNWLDFVIVVGGVIDMWLMPFFTMVEELLGMEPHHGGDSMGQIMTTLRMARLLRILRLVRLVKNIPPLFTLIVGILQAMQGMAWVLVLTAVFLYAFALLCVRLVGHGLLFGGRAPPEVADIFPTVPQSMFVLFKAMNGDTEPIEPLFHSLPMSKLGFVLYMVVSSWAILSILTAVVSENMIKATEQHRNELDEEQKYTRENEVREYLDKIFQDADTDKSGELGSVEFEGMLSDKEIAADLTEKTGLKQKDLEQIFSFLNIGDKEGKVSREIFVEALQSESRTVTERSVFRLEKRLMDLQMSFERHLEERMVEKIEADCKAKAHTDHINAIVQGAHNTLLSRLRKGSKEGVGPDGAQKTHIDKESEPRPPVLSSSPIIAKAAPVAPVQSSATSAEASDGAVPNRRELEDQLLPFQVALQIIEHRLDSICLESNPHQCEPAELSRIVQKEASCEALLVNLEEHLGMSKHNVRSSLQSILAKTSSIANGHSKMPQLVSTTTEPWMRQIELQLQTHHQSQTESLMANLERKLDMSQTWRQVQSEFACLFGKYEMRLQLEMNRGVAAAQDLSSILQSASSMAASAGQFINQASMASSMARQRLDGSGTLPAWTSPHFESPPKVSVAAAPPQVMPERLGTEDLSTIAGGATGGTLE